MITIIHGDDIAKSRAFLQKLKEEKSPLIISPSRITITDLSQIFEGTSLFSEQKSAIIEDFLSKTRKSKEKDAILSYLASQGEHHDITFWEGKLLTRSEYSAFKNPTERVFKLPQSLFQFLDEIKPNNSQIAVKLFHESLKTSEPELVFSMIVRQIRILLALISKSEISETKRIAPWQAAKLHKQSALFGEIRLTRLHSQLFAIESQQKTGTLQTNLISTIDFFLLSL